MVQSTAFFKFAESISRLKKKKRQAVCHNSTDHSLFFQENKFVSEAYASGNNVRFDRFNSILHLKVPFHFRSDIFFEEDILLQ